MTPILIILEFKLIIFAMLITRISVWLEPDLPMRSIGPRVAVLFVAGGDNMRPENGLILDWRQLWMLFANWHHDGVRLLRRRLWLKVKCGLIFREDEILIQIRANYLLIVTLARMAIFAA